MKKNYPTNAVFYLTKTFNIFLFICFLLVATGSYGQSSPQTFNSSGTFTVPAGVTRITVQAWGGGEDGVDASRRVVGGGGGGGAYAESTFNVTSGNSYRIIVGAHGPMGGNSSIALSTSQSTLIVKAEGGGQTNIYKGGRASNSIGNTRFSGGDGYSSTDYYGGGGGSAGSTGNGQNANTSNGGNGGNGTSGDGGNYNSAGNSPGGGGGEFNSYDGGNGRVVVSWCPARPDTPGTMTGPSAPCAGETGIVYSVPTLANASIYVWTVPSGWTITSGADTNSITVTVGSSGNITVKGENTCGEQSYTASQRNIGTVAIPSAPGNSSPYNFTCNGFTAQWGPHYLATSYYIDVATSTSFSAGTILPSYDNLNVGNVQFLILSGLSSGTTYYYRVRSSSSCGTSANSSTMNGTTTGPKIGTTSSDQSICSGSSPSNITLTGNTGTVQWQVSSNNISFTNISGATSNTLTSVQIGTLTATRYYRAVVTSGGCSPVNPDVVTITVNPGVSAPIVGTRTQPTCAVGTGSVVLNGLPEYWKLTRSPGNVITTGTGTSTTISELDPGTYTYTVIGTGLKGEYFNSTVTGASPPFPTTPPTLTRIDPTVEFDWMEGSPDPLINNNNFLVRWSGQVQPLHSENYTFTTNSDDGVRLWVNGVQLIEDWNDHGADFRSGSITLTAGVKYNIVLEYYENAGSAVAELRWSSLSQTSQIIPQSQLFPSAICGSPASVNVVINAQPATNTIARTSLAATTSQVVCINTAITPITYSTTGATGATVTNLPTGVTGSWSGNVVTISGTPTVAGAAQTYTVTLTGGCGVITTTGTIAVTAANTVALTSAAATTSQVVCINTAITPITYSTTGATGATVTNLPTGVSGFWSGNVVTISGTPTVAGVAKTYTVTLTGGCGTVTTTGTIAVNSLISNNSISLSQTICASTAPSALTGSTPSGGSGTYTYLWQSSTTSATSGFGNAAGTRTGIGYTPGVLTTTTWFRRRVASVGGCSNVFSSAIKITVNDTPSIAAITSPASLCSGSSLNPTAPTVTANGSTVTVSGWQLETGVGSAIFTNLTVPYSVAFVDNGKKMRYYATNSCGTNSSNEVAVTVEDVVAAPTVDKTTQPDCKSNTGSVALSNLPAGSWTVNPGGYAGSTTTSNITGLNPGTYNFTVTNDSGCVSIATTDVVIEPAKTNTWNGTAWSDGTPTIDDKIIFSGDYPLAGSTADDIVACSCKVSGATSVVITKGRTLKVKYDVDVQSTGFLTFENNASLVQIDDNAINLGNIIYKRTTPEILKTDYVYWSSPVSLAALKAIQTGTLYYSFNGSGNSWVNANANTIMNTGKGYIVRGAGTWFDKGNVTLTANFVGVPNNGVIDVTIVGAGKNNLIGNPYPSAIDGDAFLAANTDVPGGPTDVLEGALYFWTHKSAIQLASGITNGTAGSGAYAYTSDDYSPFTKVGGTNSVTGNIAAGQSFFARGSSTTGKQAKFFNSMRLDGDNILDNSGFLKPASASKTEKIAATNKIEKSRIWLNLTNTQGAFKQMLLGYMTGATDNYDRGYDALSFNGNSFINFYSINNTSLLTIQGRALPIQQTDVVPLGYSSTIAGDFSISIDKTDGALSTMAVFLEDKLANTTHNLKKGAYTFTTEKGTFNDRFVLSYVDKTTLATDDFQVVENQVVITSKNKEININTSTNYIDKVFVYDVTGKQIFLKSKIDKNEFTISNLGSTNHVLVVKVLLQDNSIVTKKIIF